MCWLKNRKRFCTPSQTGTQIRLHYLKPRHQGLSNTRRWMQPDIYKLMAEFFASDVRTSSHLLIWRTTREGLATWCLAFSLYTSSDARQQQGHKPPTRLQINHELANVKTQGRHKLPAFAFQQYSLPSVHLHSWNSACLKYNSYTSVSCECLSLRNLNAMFTDYMHFSVCFAYSWTTQGQMAIFKELKHLCWFS